MKLIAFVEDRPGHDKIYAIDAIKIEKELSWKAEENFDSGMITTVGWFLNAGLFDAKVLGKY